MTLHQQRQDKNQASFESLRNSRSSNIQKINVTDIQYQNQSVLRIKQESEAADAETERVRLAAEAAAGEAERIRLEQEAAEVERLRKEQEAAAETERIRLE